MTVGWLDLEESGPRAHQRNEALTARRDDRSVTGAALKRFLAFIRREIELLPKGHSMRTRYEHQLAALAPLARPRSLASDIVMRTVAEQLSKGDDA